MVSVINYQRQDSEVHNKIRSTSTSPVWDDVTYQYAGSSRFQQLGNSPRTKPFWSSPIQPTSGDPKFLEVHRKVEVDGISWQETCESSYLHPAVSFRIRDLWSIIIWESQSTTNHFGVRPIQPKPGKLSEVSSLIVHQIIGSFGRVLTSIWRTCQFSVWVFEGKVEYALPLITKAVQPTSG